MYPNGIVAMRSMKKKPLIYLNAINLGRVIMIPSSEYAVKKFNMMSTAKIESIVLSSIKMDLASTSSIQ